MFKASLKYKVRPSQKQTIPDLRRQRQEYLCDFEATLVYTANYRTARATKTLSQTKLEKM